MKLCVWWIDERNLMNWWKIGGVCMDELMNRWKIGGVCMDELMNWWKVEIVCLMKRWIDEKVAISEDEKRLAQTPTCKGIRNRYTVSRPRANFFARVLKVRYIKYPWMKAAIPENKVYKDEKSLWNPIQFEVKFTTPSVLFYNLRNRFVTSHCKNFPPAASSIFSY